MPYINKMFMLKVHEPETGVSQLRVETFLKHVSAGEKLYNLSLLMHCETVPPYPDAPDKDLRVT